MGCSLFSMVIYKMAEKEYEELAESAMKQALSGTIPMYTDDGNYYVEETKKFTGMEEEAKKLAEAAKAAEAAEAAKQMEGQQGVVMRHNVNPYMQDMQMGQMYGGGYKRRRSSKRRSSKRRSSKRRSSRGRSSKRRPSKRRPSKRRPSKKKKSTRRRKPTRK